MSDRYQKLTIVLDRERREEDLQGIITALRMVKGVEAVALGEPTSSADWMARETVLRDFASDLFDFITLGTPFGLRQDKQAWQEIKAILERTRHR